MRGIAFFFRTHECNGLCRKLGLTPFPRNESDYKLVGASPSSSLQHTNSDTLASSDSDLGGFSVLSSVNLSRPATRFLANFGGQEQPWGSNHVSIQAQH